LHGVPPGYVPELDEAINFYAPEARQSIRDAVEHAIQSGEGWDLEVPFIRASGERIWVRAVGDVEFENGEPRRLIGAFQDISERHQYLETIKRNNLRMTLATDSGRIGLWEYNLMDNSLIWDKWMYRLHGLSPNDKTETYTLWASHLHPEDKVAAELAVKNAIEGKDKFDTEFRIVWKDGSIRRMRGAAELEYDDNQQPIKMVGVNWDVTEVHEMRAELEQQHELLQVTLESIGDAVITTDSRGITQWLNPVAQNITGWSKEKAQGKPIEQVFHIVDGETRERITDPIEACLTRGETSELPKNTVLISRTGNEVGIEDSAAPIKDKAGNIVGLVVVFHDVTEQRLLTKKMSYQATHDALTDLLNRAEFEVRLNEMLERCHANQEQHALMFIDLDHFKIINDTCGHAVGDEALIQISKLFREVFRTSDIVARLGGDEFGVILENCSVTQAKKLAQKICNKLVTFRFSHGEDKFQLGASIGLVIMDRSWKGIESLVKAADSCCYEAKQSGRNRVQVLSSQDMDFGSLAGEIQWTTEIERALNEDRFVLFAQTVHHTLPSSKEGIHAEILIRMLDDKGNLILPSVFFPAAERYHLASRIDRWLLHHFAEWIGSLSHEKRESIQMLCINLSAQSIGDRAFHDDIEQVVTQIEPSLRDKLCFDIAETAVMNHLVDTAKFIERVKNMGARIAMDDFGRGSASYAHLKELDVDLLKIDGQFVQNALNDELDEASLRSFIEVANILNVETVAKYVDEEEILNKIQQLGVDYVQGFLLHKPEKLDSLVVD
jgi:diguanylate cyclase (GGDEF)-like protein/PAS domain S-box-containing protein